MNLSKKEDFQGARQSFGMMLSGRKVKDLVFDKKLM